MLLLSKLYKLSLGFDEPNIAIFTYAPTKFSLSSHQILLVSILSCNYFLSMQLKGGDIF